MAVEFMLTAIALLNVYQISRSSPLSNLILIVQPLIWQAICLMYVNLPGNDKQMTIQCFITGCDS